MTAITSDCGLPPHIEYRTTGDRPHTREREDVLAKKRDGHDGLCRRDNRLVDGHAFPPDPGFAVPGNLLSLPP